MAKPSEDQREKLLAKLITFLRGLTVKELEKFDDMMGAFREARERAIVERTRERVERMRERKLFYSYMETLNSRGCPSAITEEFEKHLEAVISTLAKMEIPEGHLSFLPVIPRAYMGVYGLMPMVRNGDEVGRALFDPNEIIDNVEVPNKPYFIYDVEDGEGMLGKSPEEAEKLIEKQNRSCLTVDEVIALCVHSKVLSKHDVDCTGSRYHNALGVPGVYLGSGEPRLDWFSAVASNVKWGSASCRSRA